MDTPRAWVGCLGCYNSGALVGQWLEGELIGDPVAAGLATLETVGDYTAPRCVRCFSDEFLVFDTHNFSGLINGECSLREAAEAVETLEELERQGYDLGAVAAFIGWANYWSVENFQDCYVGEYDTMEEFAEQFALDTGALDDSAAWPHNCIDWEHAARELSYDFTLEVGYVFRSV